MNFPESIRPVPDSPDLSPAEQRLRMSRVEQQVNDWLGNPSWSDSEAAERNYGWPSPPTTRLNLDEIKNRASYIVYLKVPVKDADGDVVDMHEASLRVETLEEVKAFYEMSDEELSAYIGAMALAAAEIQEK